MRRAVCPLHSRRRTFLFCIYLRGAQRGEININGQHFFFDVFSHRIRSLQKVSNNRIAKPGTNFRPERFYVLITARIRRMGECTVFSLSVHTATGGGGYPHHRSGWHPMSGWGRCPIPCLDGGYPPVPDWVGYPPTPSGDRSA